LSRDQKKPWQGRSPAKPGGWHKHAHGGAKATPGDARTPRSRDVPDGIVRLYGLHPVEAALRNGCRKVLRLVATENAERRLADALGRTLPPSERVAPRDLDKLLGPDAVHQGVMLETEPLPEPDFNDLAEHAGGRPLIILDQVTDPHNVGAILRSAAAFSAAALVTTARHSPQASSVLAKAASGAVEWVPFVKVTNLARALDELKGYGFTVLGLDSEAALTIEQARPRPPVAVVLGAEGKGLRRLTREKCEHLVRLDLPGPIKSLNVSNAAALALYALRGPV
jgi:23S rRNA (guanosine2251-2'-O)-methyltransferase